MEKLILDLDIAEIRKRFRDGNIDCFRFSFLKKTAFDLGCKDRLRTKIEVINWLRNRLFICGRVE